jgi:hypothetical protein
MMRMFVLGLAALFLAGLAPSMVGAATLPLNVTVRSGVSACPYSTPLSYPAGAAATADPCWAAPAPLTAYWKQPNAFAPGGYINIVAGTTTDYSSKRPPYNVPGVDYAIGPYTPISQLKDPAIPANTPGCYYTATGFGTGSGLLTCGGSGSGFTGTVAHINFGPIGGHSCTALAFKGTPGVTAITVDDFYFFNDNGACAGSANGQFWTGSPWSPTFSNCYLDGNAPTYRTNANGYNIISAFNVSGGGQGPNLTIKYCVVNHFAGRAITMPWGATPGPNITITGSWVEGWDYSILNGHSEWWVGMSGGSHQNNVDVDHTVTIQDMPISPFGPAPFFLAFTNPAYMNSFIADANVVIDSSVGGGTYSATVSGCIGATFANGRCSGAGPYFYETALTGKIGEGQTLICSGHFIQIVNNLGAGNGYLAQWTYDGSTYAPNGNYGPVSCRNVRMRNYVGGDGGFAYIEGVYFDHFQVTNLYGDFASTQPWISGRSTCSTPAVFGGNTDLSGTIRSTPMTEWNPSGPGGC